MSGGLTKTQNSDCVVRIYPNSLDLNCFYTNQVRVQRVQVRNSTLEQLCCRKNVCGHPRENAGLQVFAYGLWSLNHEKQKVSRIKTK